MSILDPRNAKLPKEGTELLASKFRFKNGHLEILLTTTDKTNPYFTWFTPHLHPSCCVDVALHLDQNKPIVCGRPGKLARALFLKGCQHQPLTQNGPKQSHNCVLKTKGCNLKMTQSAEGTSSTHRQPSLYLTPALSWVNCIPILMSCLTKQF